MRDSALLEYLGAHFFALKASREWTPMDSEHSEPLKRIQDSRTIASRLPSNMLYYLLNPKQERTNSIPLLDVKAQDLDLQLLFASLWMLEQGSYVDINFRIQWLGYLTDYLQGSSGSLKRMVTAVQREIAHPFSRELSCMWERYLREGKYNYGTVASVVSRFVSQMTERPATLRNLEYLENKSTLGTLIFMATRSHIFRRCLLQWEEEDDQYRMVEKQGPNSSSSPVVLSYWHRIHRADHSRLVSAQHPRAMLIYLYPLFSALRELENSVLVSSTLEWWKIMMGSCLGVLEWHEALWNHLRRPKFDVECFLFHWSSLKRSLQALYAVTDRSSESVVKAEDDVKGLVKLIDEPFSLGDNPLAKPLLWKNSGHPSLPHSREIYDLEVKVMKICEDLWQDGVNDVTIISTDGNIRQLTTTGLSIIRWLGQDTTQGTVERSIFVEQFTPNGESSASTSYSDASSVHEMLKERVELEKANLSPVGDHDIIPLLKSSAPCPAPKSSRSELQNTSCPVFPKELLRWRSAWTLFAELLPWLSNVSICQDTRLIAEVSLLAGTECGSEESFLSILKDSVSVVALKKMIDFAIFCSARSPADLVPHQHLLWLLEGTHPKKYGIWSSFREISHELLYRWHSALWTNMLTASSAPEDWCRVVGPARIFYAGQTVHFSNLLGRTGAVRDHYAKLTQLRLASVHVWTQAKLEVSDIFVSSVCSASAIFQQIIFSHRKSFQEDDYKMLVSMLSVLHSGIMGNKSELSRNENEILERLSTLLKQSQHTEFLKFLGPLLLPCMNLLYSTAWKDTSFSQYLMNLGRLWLYMGELRLHLMLPSDGCDPVAKYIHKYAHLSTQLTRLELDIKVRQESEFWVRGSRNSPKTNELLLKLEDMKQELTSLSLKLVPRPDPPQFRSVLSEVLNFLKSSVYKERLFILAADLSLDSGSSRIMHEVSTWQENAMQFINRLASQFPAYRDVVQPVLLAVYELKFGLSLLQAGRVQRDLFDKNDVSIGENGFEELVCRLMQFPTSRSDLGHKISASCTELVTNTTEAIIRKVTSSLLSGSIHGEVLDLELKVMVMRVAILRCGIDTQQARVRTKDVVKAVNNIFNTLASLWSEIRERQKAREKQEEFIRFTTRTHTLETEDEIEEASFREMFVDFRDEFPGYDDDTGMLTAELDDRRAEAALKEKEKAAEDAKLRSDKAWLKIQEPLIENVVSVHKHIFGQISTLLITKRGTRDELVSDWERENALSLAYQTGVRLLGAVGYRASAKVEDILMTSHMMQVSVEHKRIGDLYQSSEIKTTKYSIYKDPNPPEMALMLEPLRQFLERVSGLLVEWPDHPILIQFLTIAKALVGISVEAPIMKALTGVELLLSKAQIWEETAAKHVSLAREMGELMKLVRRWRKLELESWPALLECTLEKHEKSAEKLWFFLYGLLHREFGENLNKEMEATISSLEEFMQTSPLGEFQRRLDLLSSFHGQFLLEDMYDDPHVGSSKAAVQKLCNALYNVGEYYSQFLPAVEEALTAGKAPIEKELKGFVKLTKWEDRGYYALAISAEKTHRKLHKLIRKYDELLKKPIMEVLSKQSLRMGTQTLATLTTSSEPSQTGEEPSDKSMHMDDKPVPAALPGEELSSSRGSPSITAWDQFCGTKVADVTSLTSEFGQGLPELNKRLPSITARMGTLLGVGVFASDTRKVEEDCVNTLEEFSAAVIQRSAELRKGETKVAVKKKALIDLLRALRDIGLSHHKSAVPKDERHVNDWFQQPGCDLAEVLMLWVHQEVEVVAGLSSIVSIENVCSVWTRAKKYYFQNVALLQRLGQNALAFNKALSLREVEVSSKYMEHLLFLQRKQRRTAFEFSSKLSSLVHLTSLLSGFAAKDSKFPYQRNSRQWMWQQKGLLDSLCHASSELVLLYRAAEASQKSPNTDCSEAALLRKAVLQISRKLDVCKNTLDHFLVPRSELVGSRPLEECWPLLITPGMQEVLTENFVSLRSTENLLQEVRKGLTGSKVPGLSCLELLFSRAVDMSNKFEEECSRTNCTYSIEQEKAVNIAPLTEHYDKIVTEIQLAVQNLRTYTGNTSAATQESDTGESEHAGTIQDVDQSISKKMLALRFEKIYGELLRLICAGAEIIDNEHGTEEHARAALGKLLGCIHAPLQILEVAGAQLLADYVVLQKAVSKLSYVLTNLFCSLYSEGFCLTKEEESEASGTKFEEADGTGMGEGEGQKDVSDQIEEEGQLLNSTEKNQDPPTDDSRKKKEKGIEMEEDFDADMLDLSDDESDDENEAEEEKDEKLESQMGEEGEKSEVVDEQLWNGDDDKNEQQQQGKEKQEKGSSMSGAEEEDLEMRAKEEGNEDGKGDKGDEKAEKEGPTDPLASDQEQAQQAEHDMDDDEGLKEDEAYEDPSGVKPRVEEELELPDDLNLGGGMEEGQEETAEGDDEGGQEAVKQEDKMNESEPMDVDDNANLAEENETGENKNEVDQGDEDNNAENKNDAEQEQENERESGKAEVEDEERDSSMNKEEESMQVDGNELQGEGPSHDEPEPEQSQPPLPEMAENMPSDSRATGGAEAVPAGVSGRQGDPVKVGQDDEDHKLGDAETQVDQSQSELLSSATEDLLGNKRSADKKSVLSDDATKKQDRPEANANRSLGDALKKWKEMVQMLDNSSAPEADIAEKDEENLNEESTGMAYEYVPKEDTGSAQVLGAATDEQLTNAQSLEGQESEDEKEKDDTDTVLPSIEELELDDSKEGQDDMEGVEATQHPLKTRKGLASDSNQPNSEERQDDVTALLALEEDPISEVVERKKENDSLVSLRMPQALAYEGLRRNGGPEEKPLTEEEMREIRRDLEIKIQSGDGSMENARVVWQKLEQMTVRLSQELAEQLRLILEPTLAAKLQGDYRSGKRINMKKIIPYVASQFRKDKIWLRRTKASKRQYQIVLAIDDSRSMSESHCGHMALEALFTICKAMSQLEIGEMAVASFGEKGNVRLLHDFDQTFSSESGLNMISQFTFKQDNTIEDEPIVDLLQYLTRLLDFKSRHSTAPSGRNDLQQLVLVIADGRFHEKESLKRRIREAMDRKQLLAFLVLDNPRESILDMQSVSFSNGAPTFTKYLDSFPFPYYILLQDIESLPRTLADLLRQWFELTQRLS